MARWKIAAALLLLLLASVPVWATDQGQVVSSCGSATYTAGQFGNMTVDTTGKLCDNAAVSGTVTTTPAVPAAGTAGSGYPPGATATSAFATGTTGGTVATLAANATKFNYLCGIHAEVGTATAAITINVQITGLTSGTFTSSANAPATAATATAGPIISQVFTPCLQSSAINTAIAITAGALGTGGVNQNVNAWGYVQ